MNHSPAGALPSAIAEGRADIARRADFMEFLVKVLNESRHLLLDAAVYILFGLLVSGLFRVFLNPNSIARHLGQRPLFVGVQGGPDRRADPALKLRRAARSRVAAQTRRHQGRHHRVSDLDARSPGWIRSP
ncbi:MAG: hypothetical protein MZV70_56135 [Desulfobacterales bacterium]|nr:hypothetical protein [Desulfobacterales bacterium]